MPRKCMFFFWTAQSGGFIEQIGHGAFRNTQVPGHLAVAQRFLGRSAPAHFSCYSGKQDLSLAVGALYGLRINLLLGYLKNRARKIWRAKRVTAKHCPRGWVKSANTGLATPGLVQNFTGNELVSKSSCTPTGRNG